MRGSATTALLERLVNGARCEVTGCYGLAAWLVSFNDQTSHLCSKHTRVQMRDQSRWEAVEGEEIER